MSTKKSSRMSEQISGAVSKYVARRKLDTKRLARCVTVAEMASRSVVTSAASTCNLVLFSNTGIDYSQAEAQYTAFKFWISESEDHYKPELAQLLYPLFTHLYLGLVVAAPLALAAKFHTRHRATFLGNPEFKHFIGQLGEVAAAEDLDQNPTIASFRAAKYSVTLTEKTYKYLLRYLETSDSGLLLQILNQEVDIVIGDPLGSGSRQYGRPLTAAPSAGASSRAATPAQGSGCSPCASTSGSEHISRARPPPSISATSQTARRDAPSAATSTWRRTELSVCGSALRSSRAAATCSTLARRFSRRPWRRTATARPTPSWPCCGTGKGRCPSTRAPSRRFRG